MINNLIEEVHQIAPILNMYAYSKLFDVNFNLYSCSMSVFIIFYLLIYFIALLLILLH